MQFYDIVFIGSGLSSSSTICHILSKVQQQHLNKTINIAVIEKSGEFWKGIAYGNRTSVYSLTINPVKDFFEETEKPLFFDWLKKFEASDWAGTTQQEKEVLIDWFLTNNAQLNQADFEGIYIPRFLYGIYISQKLENIIAECKANYQVNIDLICGEAIDAVKTGQDQYRVEILADGIKTFIETKILVLSTGCLDVTKITQKSSDKHLIINDIYEPALELSLNKIDTVLELLQPHNRNILIIGSNASASEMVHLLYKRNRVQPDNFNKIVILSGSGLPDRLYVNSDYDHILESLKELEEKENYTADALITAIEKDVKNAIKQQLSVGKIHYSLNERFFRIQKKLSAEESLKFFKDHGWTYTRITRRTSEDYYLTEAELVKAGKLHFLKGRFVKLCDEQSDGEGLTFCYKADGTEKNYEESFPIVINCTGSEQITNTSTTLIKNLLDKQIVQINDAQMGLAVDELFAANNNFYIMGPLLAGIYTEKYKFWHLENAKRLNNLAPALADTIISKIL